MDLDDFVNLHPHSDGSTQDLPDYMTMDTDKKETSPATTATTQPLMYNAPWQSDLAQPNALDHSYMMTFDQPQTPATPTAASWPMHLNPSVLQSITGYLTDYMTPQMLSLNPNQVFASSVSDMDTSLPPDLPQTSQPAEISPSSSQPDKPALPQPESVANIATQPDQGRVTRSRTKRALPLDTTTASPVISSSDHEDYIPNKRRKAKLYCVCQQPYDGEPMVQCDDCQEWFHCVCMDLDPDQVEDVDWVCEGCLEKGRATESQKELQNTTSSSTRSSPLHKCLLPSCNNSTRPDSYCSNTCAKQHAQESASSTKKPNTTRSRSASNKKQSTPPPPTVAAVSVMDLVRKNVTKSLTAALVSILTSLQRLPTELQQQVSTGPLEMAQAMASKLEQGLFEHWTTPPTPTTTAHFDAEANYKARVRSLLHNLRDKNNQGFQERVVCGDISIDDLATMTAEDMANPALRSMSASLREQSLKNSILPTAPSLPLVKKTHKGEVVMSQVSDNNHVSNSQSSTPGHLSYRRPQMIAADRNQPNPTNIPPTTAPKHPHDHKENTSAPPSSLSPSAETSHPDVYQKLFGNAPAPLTSTHDTSTQRTNIDLEQMYDDDEEGVQLDIGDDDKLIERRYGEAAYLWHGKVVMPEVANFVAKAKQVGGRSLSKKEWQTLLATGSLFVEGRIPTASANNYLMSLQARSDKYDFALLLVQCDTAAGGASSERQMQSLLTHLIYKERYGVVGRDKAKIKDFYLIPLDRDHHIPRYLQSMVDASTFGPASPSPTSPLTSTDGFLAVLILPKPLASSS